MSPLSVIIWEENRREAKMCLEAVVLIFHIATTGHRPGRRSELWSSLLLPAGLLAVSRAGELPSCFDVWGTWALVSCGAVVTGTLKLGVLCSGFILTPLSYQAWQVFPLHWILIKSEGFRILESNSFCRLVLLGMKWNSPSFFFCFFFLRNGCYSHDYLSNMILTHLNTHGFRSWAPAQDLFKQMEFFFWRRSVLFKSLFTICYIYIVS